MRVAFVGKGGAGKSTVAGTFARALARRGEPVLAVDSDPMPGLAFSIGVEVTDAGLPDDVVVEHPGEGPPFRLRPGLSAAEAVERYTLEGPDGVRVLQFGKLRGHVSNIFRSQVAFRQIVDGLPPDLWNVVGDLPAGTRQAFFGWAGFARTVLVVVEPTAASLLSARRLARLAERSEAPAVVAVANKCRQPGDAELVAERTGLDVIAAIPLDEAVADAERRGRPPIEDAPGSPAVAAVESLVERLRSQEGAG